MLFCLMGHHLDPKVILHKCFNYAYVPPRTCIRKQHLRTHRKEIRPLNATGSASIRCFDVESTLTLYLFWCCVSPLDKYWRYLAEVYTL